MTSHLHSSVSKRGTQKNSADLDRVAATQLKSDEFFCVPLLFIKIASILCLKRLKRLLHLLGSGDIDRIPPRRCCCYCSRYNLSNLCSTSLMAVRWLQRGGVCPAAGTPAWNPSCTKWPRSPWDTWTRDAPGRAAVNGSRIWSAPRWPSRRALAQTARPGPEPSLWSGAGPSGAGKVELSCGVGDMISSSGTAEQRG